MTTPETTEDQEKPIVLIVDDAPANVQIMALMFRNLYQVKVATSGEKCLEIAQSSPQPDLILLDILMPDMDGFETIRRLKDNDHTAGIPVIFVTGLQETHDEEKSLKLGAADYIRKPVREAIAISRINTHITLRKQRLRLEELALTDQLTGLYNRHYLLTVAEQKVASSKRHRHPLSIMMVDIDHFKQINDNHGHPVGDQVLSEFGEFLRMQYRKEDLVAVRFGGEEFVVLLENCNLEQATKRSEQIRKDVETLKPADLVVTASIGVAELHDDENDFQALLERADKAVYKAKFDGRNCVRVSHEPELDSESDSTD